MKTQKEKNDLSKDPLLTFLAFCIHLIMALSIALSAKEMREQKNSFESDNNTVKELFLNRQ